VYVTGKENLTTCISLFTFINPLEKNILHYIRITIHFAPHREQ